MACAATDQLVAIESRAAGQGPDADGEAFPRRHEAFVEQIDVGDAVDLLISDDAGLAIAAEADLGAYIDLERATAPGLAWRPCIARERPGDRSPWHVLAERWRFVFSQAERHHAGHQAGGERCLDDRAALHRTAPI